MKHEQINSSLSKPKNIGIFIVVMTFGVFGTWAVVAPLQEATLAPGVVMVKGSSKKLEHLEGGIVAELLARDGDAVTSGDLLIRLDGTQAKAQLEISQSQFYAVKAREARLRAERDSMEAVIYPDVLVSAEDPRAKDAIQSQNQLFGAAQQARLGEIEMLNQKIGQLHEQIKGDEALKAGKEKMVRSYSEEVADFTKLLSDGFVGKQRLRELERYMAEEQGEVAELVSSIARLKILVSETRMQILQLEKDFQTDVTDELSATLVEVYDLDERIRAASDRLNRTQIRSPVSGVVVGMVVTTIGEIVSPAETLLYVVPQTEELIIEAKVNPIDIDRISNGQSANIRFSSFKSSVTPVIDGEIVSISADALSDERSGDYYYLARVELSSVGLDMLQDLTLVPGMPVEVFVNTGSRTLLQYLTQPIRDAFARSLIED
ncbi:MAG: HlyD family type I secretion periplasmic adaptor subunit [Halioglobus sp.]